MATAHTPNELSHALDESFFYRYHPRDSKTLLGQFAPLVDWSVLFRMADGSDGYAPLSLPLDFRIRMPNGTVVPFLTPRTGDAPSPNSSPLQARAEMVLADLRHRQATGGTDQFERFSVMHDTIWWRRAVYYVLLFLILLVACYPLFAEYVSSGPLDRLEDGAVPIVGRVTGIIEFFTPGHAVAECNHPQSGHGRHTCRPGSGDNVVERISSYPHSRSGPDRLVQWQVAARPVTFRGRAGRAPQSPCCLWHTDLPYCCNSGRRHRYADRGSFFRDGWGFVLSRHDRYEKQAPKTDEFAFPEVCAVSEDQPENDRALQCPS